MNRFLLLFSLAALAACGAPTTADIHKATLAHKWAEAKCQAEGLEFTGDMRKRDTYGNWDYQVNCYSRGMGRAETFFIPIPGK